MMTTRFFPLVVGLLLSGTLGQCAQVAVRPGVALTFTSTGGEAVQSDTIVAPNVWLHVTKGAPPSPFLAAGPFTATWRGFLSVDLRGSYTLQAEVNGSLRVEINAREVLAVSGDGGLSDTGPPLRLNKGTNDVLVVYTPAESGDPHVRLFWTARNSYPQLIPSAAWSHLPDDPMQASRRRHRGRELIIEYRCARCHAIDGQGVPDLLMNAPTFEGIASRRNPRWIREWLANPAAARANTRMPVFFHGGDAIDAAEAIGAFLGTLGDPNWSAPARSVEPADVVAGEKLFAALHCAACHNPPGAAQSAKDKISFEHVAKKFTPGALARFLTDPAEHFGAIRMPNFRLSQAEAGQLAAFVSSKAATNQVAAPRPELAPKGRDLVQTTGCLKCHALGLENQLKTPRLTELKMWDAGCMSLGPMTGTRVPFFGFAADDRRAIREFAEGGFDSLNRHVEADFAARQMANLNCAGCHNHQIGLVPHLSLLGGKIKPEYGAEIIAGRVSDKPRPWLAARMPGFATRAEGLARGLASIHGFPTKTPAEPEPIDEELAKVGFKLVQLTGGFSCISCHAIGQAGATPVIESAGINFAWTFERIQHDYFVRWLRNPLAIEPATTMPVFFDESGRSPLVDVLHGSTQEQIEAMWQYFRNGRSMKVPPEMGAAPSKPADNKGFK